MIRTLLAVALALASAPAAAHPELREGDLLFHTSRSQQSAAIQLATRSRYSHVAVVVEQGGRLVALEAVQPVKYTPISKWVARGEGGAVVVKRLRDEALLSPERRAALRAAGAKLVGRDYDLVFGWSDERMYCSELVWKVYREALGVELSAPRKLRDFDLRAPAVKQKLRERYGGRIPLDEQVVSPQDLFESRLLKTVEERKK